MPKFYTIIAGKILGGACPAPPISYAYAVCCPSFLYGETVVIRSSSTPAFNVYWTMDMYLCRQLMLHCIALQGVANCFYFSTSSALVGVQELKEEH